MIDAVMFVCWWNWSARNDVTHNKPLPAVEVSRRFLCSYVRTLRDLKDATIDEVIKGKHFIDDMICTSASCDNWYRLKSSSFSSM